MQIQERAITTSDYEILLKQAFPEIRAVSAYGGEDLIPPQFGKVAVSVYLGEGREGLSTTLSSAYIEYLRERSPLAIEPIFINSEFIYSCLNIEVFFNPKITRKSSGEIETLVRNAIANYTTTNLDNFNTTLRLSKLSADIDNVDISIRSNTVIANPYIEYSPPLNISLSPAFKFYAQLIKPYPFKDTNGFDDYKPSVKSSIFTYNGVSVYLQDDGLGNIQIVTSDLTNPQVIKPIAGSVNYTTGEINLVGFITSGYTGSGIKIMVTTKKEDITAPNGRIFFINDSDVTINLTETA